MEPKPSLVDIRSTTFWIGILAIVKGLASLFDVEIPIPDEALLGGLGIGLRRAVK